MTHPRNWKIDMLTQNEYSNLFLADTKHNSSYRCLNVSESKACILLQYKIRISS